MRRWGYCIFITVIYCSQFVEATPRLGEADSHLQNIIQQTDKNVAENKNLARNEELMTSKKNFQEIQRKSQQELTNIRMRIRGLSSELLVTPDNRAIEAEILRLQALEAQAQQNVTTAGKVIAGLDKAMATGGPVDTTEAKRIKGDQPPSTLKCGSNSRQPCSVSCGGGGSASNTCACPENASKPSCKEQRAKNERAKKQKLAKERERAAAAKRKESQARRAKSGDESQPAGSRKPLPEKNDPFNNFAGNSLTPWQDSLDSPNQCSFNSGTKMSTKYKANFRKCNQNKMKAERVCDANQNTGIKEAMNKLKAITSQMSQLTGKSLAATCDRYSVAMKNLEQSLYDYQAACLPIKAACENTCMSTVNGAKSVSEVIANDAKCFSNSGPMSESVRTDIKTAGAKVKACMALQRPLDQAKSDAEQLISSVQRSNLCERVAVEKCRLDSGTGDCVDVGIRDVGALGKANIGNLDTSASHEDGQIHTNKPSNRGKTSAAPGPTGTLGQGSSFSKSKSRQSGPTGAIATSSRKVSSTGSLSKADHRKNNYRSSSRRKRSYKGRRYSFDGSSSHLGKNAKGSRNQKRNSELENYLPGGKNDPSNRGIMIDGITGALGPSIFEKVSARYRLYKPKMLQSQ